MIQILISLLLGAWNVSFPVDGLTEKNSAAFRDRIVAHFKSLKDDEGRPLLLHVKTVGDIATITVDCPVGEIRLSAIRAALEGSDFSVKLKDGSGGHWMVHGRATFRWTSEKKLSDDVIKTLKSDFKEIGTGTTSVEVTSVEVKAGFENRLTLSFGDEQSAPAFKVIAVLDAAGHKGADLVWEKGDRATCGARRYTTK